MAKKVSKGTPVRGHLSAKFFNDAGKMLRDWRNRGNTGGGELPGVVQQRSVVYVKSVGASHDPVDAGGIMQIYQQPSLGVSVSMRTFKAGNPWPMLREPILPVIVPSYSVAGSSIRMRRFVVLIDRLESGGVARAVVHGPTYAKVKISANFYQFAQILDGETGHLEQSPTGFAEVLYREDGDVGDIVDAMILITGQPGSILVKSIDPSFGSESAAIPCYVQSTGLPSSSGAFTLIAHAMNGSTFPAGTVLPAVYKHNHSSVEWMLTPFVPAGAL